MRSLLLLLSGVDRALLSQAPRETPKFVGVGGAVLMTALMAGLSAGYALHVSLDTPVGVTVLLGALWGLGILNLDRWIITSTRRQGSVFKDITMVLPRLLLAVIIGAVISEPLVLRIFNGEIESELRRMKTEQLATFERELAADPRYERLPADEAEILKIQRALAGGVPADAAVRDPEAASLAAELTRVNAELAEAESAVACEGSGTCGSGTAGAGPVFEANVARRDRLQQEKDRLDSEVEAARERAKAQAQATFDATFASESARLVELQERVEQTRTARAAEVAENAARVDDADGMLARVEALHRLTKDSEAMHQARLALFLFILAIECMPVLVKLFMNLAKPGPYELLQYAEDEADHARAVLRLTTEVEEAQMQAQVALDAAEQTARTELDAHIAAARALLDAQVQVVTAAAATWKHEQLELLETAPASFFGTAPVPAQATDEPRIIDLDAPTSTGPAGSDQLREPVGAASRTGAATVSPAADGRWTSADETAYERAARSAAGGAPRGVSLSKEPQDGGRRDSRTT